MAGTLTGELLNRPLCCLHHSWPYHSPKNNALSKLKLKDINLQPRLSGRSKLGSLHIAAQSLFSASPRRLILSPCHATYDNIIKHPVLAGHEFPSESYRAEGIWPERSSHRVQAAGVQTVPADDRRCAEKCDLQCAHLQSSTGKASHPQLRQRVKA